MLVYNKTQADIGSAFAEALMKLPVTYPVNPLSVGADVWKKARNLADKAWQMAYFDGAHTVHLIYKKGFIDVIDGDDPVPDDCKIAL